MHSKNFFLVIMTHFSDLYYIRYKMMTLLKTLLRKLFCVFGIRGINLNLIKLFFSLIAKISTNLCYDHFRHVEVRRRHESLIPVDQNINTNKPEADILGSSLEKEIQKIVEHDLPEKCRQVFILSRVENLSNNEISKKLGISIRTVENQVYRAIKILRKKLKNYM